MNQSLSDIVYKIADTEDELNQIYQLNYKTFVEEIPQHPSNEDRKLVDKFDKENIYLIAKKGDEVIGMLCIRDKRPFSLDYKIPNLDSLISLDQKACEVRLLSVKKEYRHTTVFPRLIQFIYQYGKPKGYKWILISGTERQVLLYKKMGFEVFGNAVGTNEALYYPMYMSVEKFEQVNRIITN